ncbi:hypothetical protein Xen7305DRAFT_00005810 [Xenococcus sp. PCC 7305]|uniref:hypothetical protein n=1 Tax=Xenococcus sp. PCC 7305 TaxID=102125 RepID=UPI0002AC9302|nr:hypothetical protein [Xenococcus sp. PCC 7305]ELS00880.1 hypothetical protein Xen7305DRAFT_00005810 [Xenococcus sp. PCC 7305]
MNNYPQLSPLKLREEAQPGYQAESWQPTWNCFCCHDTGFVQYSLVKKIIKNYVPDRHKPVECNASSCNIRLGETLYETNTLDRRFDPEICDRLDAEERQIWKKWRHEKHRKRLESLELNCTKNLRARSRTQEEQFEVERRHQEMRNNY